MISSSFKTNMTTVSFLMALKNNITAVFSDDLGKCTKVRTILQLKEHLVPVFKPKGRVPLAVLKIINKEHGRLETLGFISPIHYSEWAVSIRSVKYICVWAYFSTWLNECILTYTDSLPFPEAFFLN